MSPETALRVIKAVHTAAWAFFAGCILAIPIVAWQGNFSHVIVLTGLVFFEIGILIFNGWACPLTRVAQRYTEDRRDNFDIYLPLWLARHNKTIFGWIFAAALLFALAAWRHWIG